jgi:hypothetical protein
MHNSGKEKSDFIRVQDWILTTLLHAYGLPPESVLGGGNGFQLPPTYT